MGADELSIQEAAPAAASSPASIARAEHLFRADHAERLARVGERLTATQRSVLNALPLLFHANHPALPGFSASDTPSGIMNYRPDTTARAAVRQFSRNYQYVPAATQHPEIRALFLMGSAGSVAHTRNSDLDVWVCVAPHHVSLVSRKLEALTRWAASLGVELQGFAVTAEEFNNTREPAYAPLLLDEFYRTGCHLAGQVPLWWVLPPDPETYASRVRQFEQRRLVNADRYIDFGPVRTFQPDELLAAGVQDLERSLTSPHKSLLKLALLESYAAGATPLSSRYHQTILSNSSNLNTNPEARAVSERDSYLMLAMHIDEYFDTPADRTRQRFLRRAWLTKTSRGNTRLLSNQTWWQLARAWGYEREAIEFLRWPATWSLSDIVSEHQQTMAAYAHALSFLDSLARRCQPSAESDRNTARLKTLRQQLINNTQYNDRLLPALVPSYQQGSATISQDQDGNWCLEEKGRTFIRRERLAHIFLWLKRQRLGLGALAPALRANDRYRQIHNALQKDGYVLLLNAESSTDALITDADDPLAYGNNQRCQVNLIELLHTDPDGRSETHAWQHLAEALPLLLQRPAFHVECIGDVRRARIAQRVHVLIDQARAALIPADGRQSGNFLFTLANHICCLHRDAYGRIESQFFPNRYAAYLSCPGAPITVFASGGHEMHRGWLASDNVMDTPTLILNTEHDRLFLDYRCRLGTERLEPPLRRQEEFVQSLSLFCAALKRRGIDVPTLRLRTEPDRISRLPRPEIDSHLRFRLAFAQQTSGWSIQCGAEVWSLKKLDKKLLGQVRRHVMNHRQGNADYPIYLTDIELNNADFITHLKAKFALESILSKDAVDNTSALNLFRDLA